MNLNPQTQGNTAAQTLKDFTPPKGGSLTCPSPPTVSDIPVVANEDKFYCKDANGYAYLYCVDLDSQPNNVAPYCTKGDYIVQGFRSWSDASDDKGELGYMLGIRVYRADAMTVNSTLKTTVDTQGKSRKLAAYTGGAGDRTTPLVEMTTVIRTEKTTYETLKKRLGVKSD